MNSVTEFEAINAALRILRKARVELMDGPEAVWTILAHASVHLEARAVELVKQLQTQETEELTVPLNSGASQSVSSERDPRTLWGRSDASILSLQ